MAPNDAKTILVVDDENMFAEMLVRYLKREGFRGLVAPDSKKAFSILKRVNVDMVLLDIKLSDEDGFQVLKTIKGKYPSLPVVMLTGLGNDEDTMDESLRLGASGYISKSDSIDEVGVVIRSRMPK